MKLKSFKGIDTFLFDLGGVIIDIDVQVAISRFSELGFVGIEEQITQSHHKGLFKAFERGDIDERGFIDSINKQVDQPLSDEAIIEAWNSILRTFPVERVHILEQLHQTYPTYILSNTNGIHLRKFSKMATGYQHIEELFSDAFYSFQLGCSKPERCAFEKVIELSGLNPQSTLFLDDSEKNLEVAAELGFKIQLVSQDNPMEKIFK